MNPKQFLQLGGAVLVLIALLGFWGIIGPGQDALFGDSWWFDNYENWAHLVLGVVALLAVWALPMGTHKPLTLLVGVVAILFGLYSLFVSTDFLGANLENPADTVLHLLVGAWALWAGLRKSETLGM